jgi:hypothetical protein
MTTTEQTRRGELILVGLVTALTTAGSLVFACAAPLAAVAAIAACAMGGRGLPMVIAAWATNQIVGYGWLHYPLTADSVAWGLAIGAASVLAYFAATAAAPMAKGSRLLEAGAAFAAAVVSYEVALVATALVLPSSAEANSWMAITQIVLTNAVAFAGLLAVRRLASAAVFLRPAIASRT